MTVDEGHRIGHRVKDRLVAEFAGLRDVLVHLEPYPHVHGEDAGVAANAVSPGEAES